MRDYKVSYFLIIMILVCILCGSSNTSKICTRLIFPQNNVYKVVEYLEDNYNSSLNLIYESEDTGTHFLSSEYAWMVDIPYNCTFWLMSDNLLAKYALEPWNRSLSNSIDGSLDRFGYNETMNRSRLWEVCFGYDIPNRIKDCNRYCVSYNLNDCAIFVELHNSSTPMIIEDYADLLCFHALDLLGEGNRSGAEYYLKLCYQMWDGKGFYDASTAVNGAYSNYKKGVFLFTAKILKMEEKFPKYDDIEYMLWTQLNPTSGGITSLMDSNGRQLGSANCETSSWCLMVYNNALIKKLRSKYDTTIGLNKSYNGYVVIGVFIFVIILYSFSN